jgi:hypothetical protein
MPAFQLLQVTDPHLFGDATRELYGLNRARPRMPTSAAHSPAATRQSSACRATTTIRR